MTLGRTSAPDARPPSSNTAAGGTSTELLLPEPESRNVSGSPAEALPLLTPERAWPYTAERSSALSFSGG
jgi:hypothetical protein